MAVPVPYGQPGPPLLPPRRSRRGNTVLGTLAVFGALLVSPVTVSRLVGGEWQSPVPQLAAFTPWAGVGWALAVLLLLAGRWWRTAAVALLALALHVWWVVPPADARGVGAGQRAVALRVLTVNAEFGEADPAAIARLVSERDVDLLAVQELEPALAAAVDGLVGGRLVYSDVHPVPDSPSGTGIWSRHPITPLGLLDLEFRNPRVALDVPGGPTVTVAAVHTAPPRPVALGRWRRDLGSLASTVRSTQGPQLLLGDFNASRDHRPFRDLLGSGVVDAADVRVEPGFTWPADGGRLPAAVRIDHVLVTPGDFGVGVVTTHPVPGTDHRAVLAELTVG